MPISIAPRRLQLDLPEDIDEIYAGLDLEQKSTPPKFLYDDEGSKLFDAICDLPEYYPTRTELHILRANAESISRLIGHNARLIEYGSGSSMKTRILLAEAHDIAEYVPVDISRDHLLAAAKRIRSDFPQLRVGPIVADFSKAFVIPPSAATPARNVIFFPGSTVGNFSKDSVRELISSMYDLAGEGGALLIGVDLRKDRSTLEHAYNDSQGVTAAFNLNLLHHLNRQYGATFDTSAYRHRAVYNEQAGRIEMYLDSLASQVVNVGTRQFVIEEGESILTEFSYKYDLDGFAELVDASGFRVRRVWLDDSQLFSVQYCVRD